MEPAGPPDRLDVEGEGEENRGLRLEQLGWGAGHRRLRKQIWGRKFVLWLGHVKLDVESIEFGAQDQMYELSAFTKWR